MTEMHLYGVKLTAYPRKRIKNDSHPGGKELALRIVTTERLAAEAEKKATAYVLGMDLFGSSAYHNDYKAGPVVDLEIHEIVYLHGVLVKV